MKRSKIIIDTYNRINKVNYFRKFYFLDDNCSAMRNEKDLNSLKFEYEYLPGLFEKCFGLRIIELNYTPVGISYHKNHYQLLFVNFDEMMIYVCAYTLEDVSLKRYLREYKEYIRQKKHERVKKYLK